MSHIDQTSTVASSSRRHYLKLSRSHPATLSLTGHGLLSAAASEQSRPKSQIPSQLGLASYTLAQLRS